MSQSISQKFTPISLLKFALPSMVMMMFMSCYTIVDGIFISRYLGSEALSAANIVYPVFNLLLAVGIMFATGGSAVVSKKLGEGKKEEAMEDFSGNRHLSGHQPRIKVQGIGLPGRQRRPGDCR